MPEELPTAAETLHSLAGEVEVAFGALLDRCGIHYNDINTPGSGAVFIGWNPHRWDPLKPAEQRLVGRATQAKQRFDELGAAAINAVASERHDDFQNAGEVLRRVAQQDDSSRGAPASTVDGVRQRLRKALDEQLTILASLPSAHGEGGQLLVPDTNALLYKPDLERWEPPAGEWTAVLVPQVVRELDQLKLRPAVSQKAEGVVRRLKEYGRRGDTLVGVRIASRLRLRELAVDADMARAPSWLQRGHADDELLASVLELQWDDLKARVVLATRDRNLQNKARFARVPYLDVEDEV